RMLGVLGIAACVGSSASADPSLPPKVAVLPIKLLDTSAEPLDQSADHDRRLAALASDLTVDLGKTGLFRTVEVEPEVLRQRCPDEAAECLLEVARDEGARLMFLGVVHKSSTLILQMWARFVDAETRSVVFSRELSFRGDTDEAWRRAEAFLVEQIRSTPPR
ncbi:DUF2380 domain-containing protein, partial [Microvirga massiliensis]|uniref:DUF2380 domain-containing protein n=1 Tax=Microvirga massiliensis TaxID=1033741 RepID=UPI0009E2C305